MSALQAGESGYVTELSASPAMELRLKDLGLVRGTRVTCVLQGPGGGLRAYLIRGALIALRRAEAAGRRRARKGERTMTVRALGERIEAYFAACDATRERMEQRNGAAAYRQVPYTLAGLAAATGLGKAELLRLAADGGRRGALVRAALLRVERHLSERALMGELQATMAQALLRELAPEAAGEGDERRVVVVLDDREGWSG